MRARDFMPLAPVLGQGTGLLAVVDSEIPSVDAMATPPPPEFAAKPHRQRRAKRGVNAWGRIVAALQAAPGPLSCGELRTATGLDPNNLGVALATHKRDLTRTGERRGEFRYALAP